MAQLRAQQATRDTLKKASINDSTAPQRSVKPNRKSSNFRRTKASFKTMHGGHNTSNFTLLNIDIEEVRPNNRKGHSRRKSRFKKTDDKIGQAFPPNLLDT